jgi:ankyrin repeat protein
VLGTRILSGSTHPCWNNVSFLSSSSKGAELKSKNNDGWTPLWRAVGNGHKAVVKLLLEKGAELKSKDNDGWTPLSWAADEGHKMIVKLLLELESKDNDGQTPLLGPAWSGRKAVVKLLLKKGAELESRDNNGRTPLWQNSASQSTQNRLNSSSSKRPFRTPTSFQP